MRFSVPLCLTLLAPLAAHADDPLATRFAQVAENDPLGESVTRVVYLSQNWSPSESLRFYFTSQGSQVIPYEWFLALEQPDSQARFRDNQNLLKYRYLTQTPSPSNPDGLPVGFVADDGNNRRWLGFTCAACHTTEIHLGNTAYRVDGGPGQGDIEGLLVSMTQALRQTRDNPDKFARFAHAVLGDRDTTAGQALLKTQLSATIARRDAYNLRNFPNYNPVAAPPPPSHYARLDAFGAIINEVYHHSVRAADNTSPTVNTRPADAPVSYPFLWDTPQHDKVQWIGIDNGGPLDILSLARNVGEVLGVFADFQIPEDPDLLSLGYASTVRRDALVELEDLVKRLWSPQWPADFPPINRTAAQAGRSLYVTHCIQCHADINRTDPFRRITAVMDDAKTDPRTAANFVTRSGPAGKLAGAPLKVIPIPFGPRIGQVADAKTMLSNTVIGTILGVLKDPPPDPLAQITFQVRAGDNAALEAAVPSYKYKSRPLNGIWATAPYLHNGSVPNLAELLQPTSKRSTSFSIGNRAFDPVNVGFRTDVAGFPRFQVNDAAGQPIPGNSNAGHEYGTNLNDEQRSQLLEYLKTL